MNRTQRITAGVLIGAFIVTLSMAAFGPTKHPQHPHACWTESKSGTQFMPERICGDVSKAPMDAVLFGDTP